YQDTVFADQPGDEPIDPYTPTFSPYSPRPFDGCPDYQRYGGNMVMYRRLYAGLVSQVDAGVGRIVAALKELGCYDDTLIVYTSDHGDMQGSHGLKNKCYPHEKSAGVPFIARVPSGVKGLVSDELVSGVDIFPTALEAAGAPRPEGLDGQSFLGYLRQGAGTVNDYIISEYVLGKQPWRMIRTPRYKLTVTMAEYSPLSLFDMQADPYELTDLKTQAAMAPVIAELTATLRAHTEKVGSTAATPEQQALWYPQRPSLTGNS
ncbi:MAG: sulfatase, partial [Aristaeellaceae bacterium]